MCIGQKPPKPTTPAPAPAPPLEPPEAPDVGDARKLETKKLFGSDAPDYRVKRGDTAGSLNPSRNIVM